MNKYNKLIFEDNFNKPQLDLDKWSIVHLGNGFGNNEWQFYRNDSDNISIKNNQLVITCKKEVYEHRYFTSGKIQSRNKFSFNYTWSVIFMADFFYANFYSRFCLMRKKRRYKYVSFY